MISSAIKDRDEDATILPGLCVILSTVTLHNSSLLGCTNKWNEFLPSLPLSFGSKHIHVFCESSEHMVDTSPVYK